MLDLDYAEDSQAETDMNVVMNDGGAFIEVQGTAEGHAFRREELDAMLDLARRRHPAQLFALQREAPSGREGLSRPCGASCSRPATAGKLRELRAPARPLGLEPRAPQSELGIEPPRETGDDASPATR